MEGSQKNNMLNNLCSKKKTCILVHGYFTTKIGEATQTHNKSKLSSLSLGSPPNSTSWMNVME